MLFTDYGDGEEEHFIYLSSEDMEKGVECFYDVPTQDDFNEDEYEYMLENVDDIIEINKNK
jgi:hypothetical protein